MTGAGNRVRAASHASNSAHAPPHTYLPSGEGPGGQDVLTPGDAVFGLEFDGLTPIRFDAFSRALGRAVGNE